MSLKYALLGFLSTEPASGYTLAQEFGESMGWFWYASTSQIYPELHRLEQDGLVASIEAEGKAGKPKKVYRITPAGLDDLRTWVTSDVEYPPTRDPERIKLVLLDEFPEEDIVRHLERHRAHYAEALQTLQEQLAQIQDETFPRLVKRKAERPAEDHPMITALKALAIAGNIARARTEIAWTDDALILVRGLSRRQHGGTE